METNENNIKKTIQLQTYDDCYCELLIIHLSAIIYFTKCGMKNSKIQK